MMMKKLSIILLALILISCNTEKESSTLSVAVSQEPPTLDVVVNTSLISRIIASGNIFEKLLSKDSNGDIKLELAESYSLRDDNKKLSFTLKKNIRFHDGSYLTNRDASLSMNRWLSIYKPAHDIAGDAMFYETEDGIAIESDNNLSFLPLLIASAPQAAAIMPQSIISNLKMSEVVSEYIGTGPYKLKEWKSGESITLEKYKEYNTDEDKNKGTIDTITYYFVSDSVTRALGLKSGLYDFANDVMSEDRALYKDSDIEVLEGGETGSIGIIFNKSKGLTANVEFRRALSLAIDPEKTMKACYGEYGWHCHTDYMEIEQVFSLDDENPYRGRDEEKSKLYLAKSGYNNEAIRILTSNTSNLDKMAISIASDLEKAGIKTELIILDWASMMERRKNKDAWDLLISAYTTVPLPQMKLYLSPDYPGWIEDDVDILKEMNDKSLDECIELWRDAQMKFWESVPLLVPGHYLTSYAKNKSIKDVVVNGGFYFWNASKDNDH